MATTDRLNVAITADASQFNKQIKSIQGQLDKTVKSVNQSMTQAQQQTEAALSETSKSIQKATETIPMSVRKAGLASDKEMMTADGRIIADAKKTSLGVEGSFNGINPNADPLVARYTEAFNEITVAAEEAAKELQRTTRSQNTIADIGDAVKYLKDLRILLNQIDPTQFNFTSPIADEAEKAAEVYKQVIDQIKGPYLTDNNPIYQKIIAESKKMWEAAVRVSDAVAGIPGSGAPGKNIQEFNKLCETLNKDLELLREAAMQAKVAVEAIGEDNSGVQDADKAVKDTTAGLKKATKGTDMWGRAGTKLTGKLSLAMILVRIIFKLIQVIVKALKDCTEILYDFDPKFAKDWEKFIGTVKQLKAELSAAFAPILQSVVPVLTEIINKVREFVQELGKAFSVLAGSDSWIKAKDQVDEYGKSVKAAKRELLGFDQVNKLNAETETKFESEDLINENQINLFKEAFEGIKKILEPILNIMTSSIADSVELLKEIGPLLQPLFDLVSAVLEPIGTIFSKALKAVTKLVSPIVNKLVPAISKIFGIVSELVDVLFTALEPALDEIFHFLGTIGEVIGSYLEVVWTIISPIVDVLKPVLSILLDTCLIPISTAISLVANRIDAMFKVVKIIVDLFGAIWNSVQAILSADWGSLGDIWKNFGEKAKKVFSDIGATWDRFCQNLGNALNNIWKKFANFFINIARGIVNWINNSIIVLLNKISDKFGWNWNIPPIQQPNLLAKGGVIKSPTTAILGEYAGANTNPEIAAPRSMIAEIVNEGSESTNNILIQLGRQIITAIDNKDLEVTIGDDVIASSAARGNRAFYNRTGKELIGV